MAQQPQPSIVGSRCPELGGLVYIKGQEVDLPHAFALGPVLLEIFTSWCRVCPRGFPHTSELQQRYGPQGLRVVAVCLGSDVEAAKRYMKQHDKEMAFAVAVDTQGAAAALMRAAGVREVPWAVLLDTQGVIRSQSNPMRLSFKIDVGNLMRQHAAQLPDACKAQLAAAAQGAPGSAGPSTPMAWPGGGAGRQHSGGAVEEEEGEVLATRLACCDLQGQCI